MQCENPEVLNAWFRYVQTVKISGRSYINCSYSTYSKVGKPPSYMLNMRLLVSYMRAMCVSCASNETNTEQQDELHRRHGRNSNTPPRPCFCVSLITYSYTMLLLTRSKVPIDEYQQLQ